MKDEIKEILEDLQKCINDEQYEQLLKIEHIKVLLDYITNLQEKNERLRAKKWQIKTLKGEWLDINENVTLVFENNNLIEFMNKLEDILNGDDEEDI